MTVFVGSSIGQSLNTRKAQSIFSWSQQLNNLRIDDGVLNNECWKKNGSEILDDQRLFKFKKILLESRQRMWKRYWENVSPHFYVHINGNISYAIYTDV